MIGKPFNSPEKESAESPYMKIFFPAFVGAATKANILGFDVGDDHFQFSHNSKTVTITIKVK